MKCDRCKEDYSYLTELTPVSAKHIKPEFGYKERIGGGKWLFCNKCLIVVEISSSKQFK